MLTVAAQVVEGSIRFTEVMVSIQPDLLSEGETERGRREPAPRLTLAVAVSPGLVTLLLGARLRRGGPSRFGHQSWF